MKYDPIMCMMVNDSVKTKDSKETKTIDKAIKSCDDLNSDKEKALEEYKEAEKKWRKITEGATLREFRQLQHSQEYLDFVKAKNKCMHLGCRI